MCGIAGILRIQDPQQGLLPPREAIPEAWLDILDESIKHRGPDGQGRFRDRAIRPDGKVVDIALVHRRLAIIDLSPKAAQPMVIHGGTALQSCDSESPAFQGFEVASKDPAQRAGPPLISREGAPYEPIRAHRCAKCNALTAIAFNGCIYNHKELRKELQSLGHEFFTDHSDTEVLVHGWCEWGMELQNRVDGMYALAVWDAATATLSICRDRAGEKPLYDLALGSDHLLFASSASSLMRMQALGDSEPILPDELGPMNLWIQYGWGVSGRPVSRRVYEVGRSDIHLSAMTLDRVHWTVETPQTDVSRPTEPLSVDRAEQMLQQGVRSRLEADVPVGIFLSGGIDSALIAAIAQGVNGNTRAITVRMPSKKYDESKAAARTARAIGISHQIVDCQSDASTELVRLIHELGLPFGDSSLLPASWVSRATRPHFPVALSGDGADELFCGYHRQAIARTLSKRRGLLKLIDPMLVPSRNPGSRSAKFKRLLNASRYGGYWELQSIFQFLDRASLVPGYWFEPGYLTVFRPHAEEFSTYLPSDILRKTDTASMSVALEVRAPFLSRQLVDASLATTPETLMPHGKRKGLLKQVALKYLPPEIVNRPKQGFAIPIGEWFRSDYGQMRQLLYDHLESAEPFPGLPLELNMDFVRQMLKEHDQAGEKSFNPWHGRDHSQRLYMLLVLSIWCKWLQGLRSESASQRMSE